MKKTGRKEKFNMSTEDENGKSENRTQAEFKADGLQQRKVYLGEQGIARVKLGIIKNKIPDIANVVQGAEWVDDTHKNKLGASLFQISFLVTIGEKMLVFARSDRNGSRNLSGFSVLLSSSPYEKVVLNKLSGLNEILKRKFNYDKEKGIPRIHSLGLIKNTVYKKDENFWADYYFYVFHAHFDEDSLTLEDARQAVHSASIDRLDCVENLYPVNEELINKKIDKKFNADRAALKLYLQYRTERMINMLTFKGVGYSVASHGVLPFNNFSDRFFVSHATDDYKDMVEPLCAGVNKKYTDSLHPMDKETSVSELTWTHEHHAVTGCDWKTENLLYIQKCAGFVAVETKAFEISDNVIEEIIEAIKGKLQNEEYRIIRVCYEKMDNPSAFEKKLRKKAAMELGDEKYADIYLKKTVFPVYANPETLVNCFVDQLYSLLL